MDARCLDYRLTDEERTSFDEQGYFVARDVLPPPTLARVVDAADRLYVEYRPRYGLSPYERLNHLDCIGFDDAFLDLLNVSRFARKILFFGYSYRWLRPRDDMTVGHYLERADPIRRQLLGASPTGGMGYTSPTDEDVPLKGWLEAHLGEDSVVS